MKETISANIFFEPFGGEHRCLQRIGIGTGDDDEVAYREELRIILPGLDLAEGIRPHNKEESLPFFEVTVVVGDGLDGI